MEALVRSAGIPRDAAIIRFLANTGLRVSEATGLRASDIREGWIDIRAETAKNKKGRSVPLNIAAREALTALLQDPPCGDDTEQRPILRGRRGKRLTPRAVQKIVERVGKRAGIKTHPHAFRHSFITSLLDAGVPVHHARDLAGHANIATTSIYSHSRRDLLRDAVEKLNKGK